MEKIASFQVDHRSLKEGIYISRVDGDITTYDLRTRKPNYNDYMDNGTMHSMEHMFATFVRNSEIKNDVIYFGPMGCQTGFYLLVRNADHAQMLKVMRQILMDISNYNGEIFGKSDIECGNYQTLDLDKAKAESARYYAVVKDLQPEDLHY